MEQESHFNVYAESPKGARGLMQLMPGTGARFGVRRAFDPAQNIAGGARFLKQLLQRFNGRVDLVLASYNAGEGAVAKFGGRVPPYRETRNYVKRVGYRYRQVNKPVRPVSGGSPIAGAMCPHLLFNSSPLDVKFEHEISILESNPRTCPVRTFLVFASHCPTALGATADKCRCR